MPNEFLVLMNLNVWKFIRTTRQNFALIILRKKHSIRTTIEKNALSNQRNKDFIRTTIEKNTLSILHNKDFIRTTIEKTVAKKTTASFFAKKYSHIVPLIVK